MTTDTQISDREREILRLVATGATNQQIAQQLHISINTVKVHLRNIFSKIGVTSRTEATVYAMRMGLVPMAHEGALPAEAERVPAVNVPPPATEMELVARDTTVEEPAIETDTAPIAPGIPRPAEDAADLSAIDVVPREQVADTNALDVVPGITITHAPAANRRVLLAVGGVAVLLLIAIVVVMTRQFAATTPTSMPGASGLNLAVPDKPSRELAALPNGRAGFAMTDVAYGGRSYLYAIGGESGSGVDDQVLRYDISANTWVPRRAKPQPVTDVQAAVIGNKIYVPGGRLASGQPTNACEMYDPARDTWTTCKALPAPRSGYALAAVEGKLYMFGGWDGTSYSADVWQYNPDTDTWTALTKMPTARAFADAVVVDRQVYVIGGENQQGALGTNERYTPADEGNGNPWNTQTSLATPSKRPSVAAVGNLIFMFDVDSSGRSGAVYNPDTDSWQALTTPFSVPDEARTHAVGTNKLYIVGGRAAQGFSTQAYEYQPTFTVFLPGVQQP